MSVVLRCPSCGTTRATPGECEACHETQVKYFCTNHTPGVWLETRTCPKCGAGLGYTSGRPPAPVPTVARTPPAAPARRPVPAPEPRPARTRAPAPDPAPESRRAPATPPSRAVDEDHEAPPAAGLASWQNILGALIRARYLPTAPEGHARPAVGRGLGGCLMRLALIVLVLFVALVIAVFVFGRALFQGLQP